MKILAIVVGLVLMPLYADAGNRVGPGTFERQLKRGGVRTKFVSRVSTEQVTAGPCYSTLAKWRKRPAWTTTDTLAAYVTVAAHEWNSHIRKAVLGPRDPDSRNTIRFEVLGEDRPAAITYLWSRERKHGRVPYLFRIVINSSFNFVDGSAPDGIDLLSVITHEAGHAIGMGHTDCADETMFRWITYGETKKRDLHAGDIAGLNALY